jgi:hypothetical protein
MSCYFDDISMSTISNEHTVIAAAQPRPVSTSRPSWLLTAVVVTAFLPEEFGFDPFGVRLGFSRLLLILAAPFVIVAFIRLISSERYRFVLSDLLMPITFIWIITSVSISEGVESGVIHGGAVAIDYVVGYLLMRTLPKGRDDIYALVRLICLCSALVGFLALADTITRSPIYHDLGTALFGLVNIKRSLAQNLGRFDLFRAMGTFEHPILLGIVMVFALVLARALTWNVRLIVSVGCIIGLVTSLSSAPLLGAVIGLGLVAYAKLFHFRHRWLVLSLFATVPFLMLFLFHPNPFGFLFGHFLLDEQTGYWRLLIWQYAGDDVLNSPIFGIGMSDKWARPEWMPPSVDSLWLGAAMNFGIPGSILIALTLVSAYSLPVRRNEMNSSVIGVREERIAESMGIVIFLVLFFGFTVYIWGNCWLLLGLLSGLRASLGQLSGLSPEAITIGQSESGRYG